MEVVNAQAPNHIIEHVATLSDPTVATKYHKPEEVAKTMEQALEALTFVIMCEPKDTVVTSCLDALGSSYGRLTTFTTSEAWDPHTQLVHNLAEAIVYQADDCAKIREW